MLYNHWQRSTLRLESDIIRRRLPRFTQAVRKALRESAAILLAVLALVLLIALFSFHPRDPGFSFSGDRRAGRATASVRVGAWVADILLFLFGRPAYLFPAGAGGGLAGLPQPPEAVEPRSRANVAVRVGGFVLLLAASCGLATLHWDPGVLPQSAGGVLGKAGRRGLAERLAGRWAPRCCCWPSGWPASRCSRSMFPGSRYGRLGAAVWRGVGWIARACATRREVADGKERKQARQDSRCAESRRRRACAPPPRIEPPAPAGGEERARREGTPGAAVRRAASRRAAAAVAAGRSAGARSRRYSAEALEAMSRLVELKLKDFGVEVEVVAVHPGPVVTRFEMRPAPGVKVSQITQPRQGPGARAVGHQRARRRGDPRQVGHGPGDPEREARDGHAGRDHQVARPTRRSPRR